MWATTERSRRGSQRLLDGGHYGQSKAMEQEGVVVFEEELAEALFGAMCSS